MKQNDIALIAVVVIISAVLSIVGSNMMFSGKAKQQQVEKVDVISTDFPQPDSRYFNSNSVDPTQPIKIQDNNNSNPFSATAQ